MVTNPLPHNQNMASRNVDSGSASGGNQNLSNAEGGLSCIDMMSTTNVVTCKKDNGLSQHNLDKYPSPPEKPFHIDKPKDIPCIHKGVLKCSSHKPNDQATQHYSIVRDLGQIPYVMSALEVFHTCPS